MQAPLTFPKVTAFLKKCKRHLHFIFPTFSLLHSPFYIPMPTPRNPTRQRLIEAALELFAQQGIAETTTKQIAEQAGVNEVTLFRQCGNKQGLLLAVLEESEVFDRLAEALTQTLDRASSPTQVIRQYAETYLSLLESIPELLRSIVGESGKYPTENKEALGRGIQQVTQTIAAQTLVKNLSDLALPSDSLMRLINSTLLGYAMLQVTTEFHGLWQNQTEFIDHLVQLVLSQPISPPALILETIGDLPASMVQTILQRAQKKGTREGALVYLLFGAGVSAVEITRLERVHYLSDREAQFLQITTGATRQVPINQWIMGKRYGNYQKNPLTQYLKSRKDSESALFLNSDGSGLTIEETHEIWQELATDLLTLEGKSPTLEQAQQTWCVEMLLRGISLEDMQILTGLKLEQLTPYGKRAKQKTVLEQGLLLDKQK
jgi:AcrR family transcriptional regulator